MRPASKRKIKPLSKRATEREIVHFLDSNDPEELEKQGIMVRDEESSDLEEILRKYLAEPNDSQVNIRLPQSAKRLLTRIAHQKTIDASTLARIWIVERLRHEAGLG